MTKSQALKETKARWGKHAWVRESKCSLGDPIKKGIYEGKRRCTAFDAHGKPGECLGEKRYYEVGVLKVIAGIGFNEVKASGTTWEACFRACDADDLKLHRDYCKACKKVPCPRGRELQTAVERWKKPCLIP